MAHRAGEGLLSARHGRNLEFCTNIQITEALESTALGILRYERPYIFAIAPNGQLYSEHHKPLSMRAHEAERAYAALASDDGPLCPCWAVYLAYRKRDVDALYRLGQGTLARHVAKQVGQRGGRAARGRQYMDDPLVQPLWLRRSRLSELSHGPRVAFKRTTYRIRLAPGHWRRVRHSVISHAPFDTKGTIYTQIETHHDGGIDATLHVKLGNHWGYNVLAQGLTTGWDKETGTMCLVVDAWGKRGPMGETVIAGRPDQGGHVLPYYARLHNGVLHWGKPAPRPR